LISSNILSALFLSTVLCIAASIIIAHRTYLIKRAELLTLGIETRNYLSYMVILALSFCLREILLDLGTGYYVLSLFNSRIDAMFFPVMAFLISSIISVCFGGGIASTAIILPVLLPLAKELSGTDGIMITTAAIIEGGIVGELLSPYSVSAIMVSSILRLSPVRHIENQSPYVLIPFATAFVSGFTLIGTRLPFYVSYLLILTLNFIIIFKKSSIRN
jgi:tetracycline resistance efflux pump